MVAARLLLVVVRLLAGGVLGGLAVVCVLLVVGVVLLGLLRAVRLGGEVRQRDSVVAAGIYRYILKVIKARAGAGWGGGEYHPLLPPVLAVLRERLLVEIGRAHV